MYEQTIIEAKNIPMWTAAGFIVALLALIISLTNLYRGSVATVINQAEILVLSQKIDLLNKQFEQKSISTTQINKP